MTINQILDEQMKKVEEYISIYPDGEESFEEVDIEPEEFRSFFHSYTRKIVESVAEEIIGKNIRHVTATMGDKDHTGDVDTDEVINALQDDIDAVNDYKEEQRLKVKEILSNLK